MGSHARDHRSGHHRTPPHPRTIKHKDRWRHTSRRSSRTMMPQHRGRRCHTKSSRKSLPTCRLLMFVAGHALVAALLRAPPPAGKPQSVAAGRPKLFFSPTEEPSDDYFFYAWQPGGAATKLMRNDLLRSALLTKPLSGLSPSRQK